MHFVTSFTAEYLFCQKRVFFVRPFFVISRLMFLNFTANNYVQIVADISIT